MEEKNKLLVMPRIVNKVGEWYQFPLGITYLSSSLKEQGHNIYTLNLNHVEGSVYGILKKEIKENNIDIVLTGGLTGQYWAIYDILKNTKKIDDSIITITGGGIITSTPEHGMEALEYADYGVIGEGEITCGRLCDALDNERKISKIPGIIYQEDSSYKRTEGQLPVVDIEKLPFPDYEGFAVDELLEVVPSELGMSEYNTLPIITSRSCPYSCTFCFHSSGNKYRKRSLDDVFSEIDYVVNEYGVQYISIIDELFGHDKERMKEFCERIKDYDIKWRAQLRVTDIDREVINMLKDSNCEAISYGLESADNRILESMNKGITIEDTAKALRLTYEAGISIQGRFIFGDIEESVETIKNTLDWWKDHIHYDIQLNTIITYPGTPIYDYAVEEGIISDPVQYIKDGSPFVQLSKHMSEEDYVWLFEQILSSPREMRKKPKNVKINEIDYNNATTDLEGFCVSCGEFNEWEGAKLFLLDILSCQNCGRKHRSHIPDDVVDKVSRNCDKLVDNYGKIAFWGINSYSYDFYGQMNMESFDDVYYVDKSKSRSGININIPADKRVQLPEVIDEEKIEYVIVSVIQYYSALKNQIKDEHPHVKEVLSISDLLS